MTTHKEQRKIKNGDVFDIGQTINGVSKFLWFNNQWYYFEERLTRKYEYDERHLTELTVNNDFGQVGYLGNILQTFK